jgi:GT2 family glycosyltransferase
MSNYAAPPQLVENVPYHDLRAMHEFARQWRDEQRGKWFTVHKLSGFCLLMKRAVYTQIGGLDERFGIGFFDDDDFAERARRAGFELAVAHDLFIHHFGSRTFRGNGIDAEKLLDENARRFAEKWGQTATSGKRVALQPWSDLPAFLSDAQRQFAREVDQCRNEGGKADLAQKRRDAKNANGIVSELSDGVHGRLRTDEPISRQSAFEPTLPTSSASWRLGVRSSLANDGADAPDLGARARVSLTMIVRDEQQNLPRCLESVRGLFDEIVVVDTGSVDRTKEIARSFGAKVFDFVWVDDFAAARNEALKHATGDYAFWLDADDVVEPAEREKLRALLDGLAGPLERSKARSARPEPCPPECSGAAYVVRCACDPGPDGAGGETVVDHIRLCPVRKDVRWTYPPL